MGNQTWGNRVTLAVPQIIPPPSTTPSFFDRARQPTPKGSRVGHGHIRPHAHRQHKSHPLLDSIHPTVTNHMPNRRELFPSWVSLFEPLDGPPSGGFCWGGSPIHTPHVTCKKGVGTTI